MIRLSRKIWVLIWTVLLLPGGIACADASFSWLEGKTAAVVTGSASDSEVLSVQDGVEFRYFNSQVDAMSALREGKVDVWACDEPVIRYMLKGFDDLEIYPEPVKPSSAGAVFPKTEQGRKLCDQYSAFLKGLWEDGTMAEINAVWFGADDAVKTVLDYENLPGPNGTLRMATDPMYPPLVFLKDDRVVGYDVDIAARFCQANGYRLEVIPMNFDSILNAVQSGKCDFASDNIVFTEERAQAVLFSTETYKNATVLAVRKADSLAGEQRQQPAYRPEYTTFDELSGKNVSMLTGAPFEELVKSRAPGVTDFDYYNSIADLIQALKAGKTDAFLCNNAVCNLLVNRDSELALFPEYLKSDEFGIAFRKGDPRRELWQKAFDTIPKEEIEALWDKWGGRDESVKTLPEQDWPGLNGTVQVAACDTLEPMSYVGMDGHLLGFDIEVLLLIARKLDVHLELTGMEFSAILASVSSGKADIGVGSIIVTPEREESSDFLHYHDAAFVLIVRNVKEETGNGSSIHTLSDLEHGRIGVITGTVQAEQVKERFPEAEISYYTSAADMPIALRTHKIDAFSTAEAQARYIRTQEKDLMILDEHLGDMVKIGAIFPGTENGRALCEQYNAFLRRIRENGVMDEIMNTWYGEDESRRVVPDLGRLPGPSGTIRMAADSSLPPFCYVKDGQIVGIETDLAVRFCREYGYALEIVSMDFSGIVPSVATEKVDFASCYIAYTPERAESVLFSDVTFESDSVMMVMKPEEAAGAAVENTSFWDGIASSFEKTFIREDRWKLFIQGVLTTLVITVLSVISGTLLGFDVFMLCRNGNPVANGITRFIMWLIQGTPMVVLLMILYYIIFGNVAISGMMVAVIGFTLTFGAAVFGLLKIGVGAVDIGQYEAAYALGYTSWNTFFRIIFPQAVPHVLSAYRGEIVSLIKSTAIVGYVAVQDLTKVGDIIRSRTYEAFFPLIAITIIYFALEMLLGFLVSRIGLSTNPKKRRNKSLLKGVRIHD